MSPSDLQTLLEALCRAPDDWFELRPAGPGRFQIRDRQTGSTATLTVEEHWVTVEHSRSLVPTGSVTLGTYPASSTMTRVQVVPSEKGEHGRVVVSGRVYVDGASIQSLIVTARDVLALAGPDRAALPAEHPGPGPEQEPAEPEEQASAVALAEPLSAAALDIREPETAHAGSSLSGAPLGPGAGSYNQRPATPVNADAVADAPTAPAAAGAPTCAHCGASVEQTERFCMSCGAPLSGAPVTAAQPKPTGSERAAPEPAPPRPFVPEPADPVRPAATIRVPLQRRSEPDTVVWRRPPAGAISCPRCGVGNDQDRESCSSCGTALGSPPAGDRSTPPQQAAASVSCRRCGYDNPGANRFCQGCGAPMAG